MIQLDTQSATPLYEQLYAALAAEIREGARPAGHRRGIGPRRRRGGQAEQQRREQSQRVS